MDNPHPPFPNMRTVKKLWHVVRFGLLSYAVVFAVVGTIALVRIGVFVYRPIREVRRLKHYNPTESAYMTDVRSHLRDSGQSDTLTHRFVPLDSISPHLIDAVIAAEDDAFYMHPGIDVAAIVSAAAYNRTHHKVRHGGSTITQQTAKNLFLDGDRTYRRKAIELAYAVLMEQILGKERILELYLNYAQWGPTLFGCEAAARKYFGKPAAEIGLYESMRMAATLARPERLTPHHTRSILMGKRLSTIAMNLYYRHRISDSTYYLFCGTPDSIESAENQAQTNVADRVGAAATE